MALVDFFPGLEREIKESDIPNHHLSNDRPLINPSQMVNNRQVLVTKSHRLLAVNHASLNIRRAREPQAVLHDRNLVESRKL